MTQRKILVIEDDPAIRQGLVDALTFAGFSVAAEERASAGTASAVRLDCDLVLLDLVLPDGSGFDILREVRSARPTLPVIILTAKGDESDRVHGLELGADDYVVKPFSARELIARVQAVLRRSPARPLDESEIALSCGTVNVNRREVALDDGSKISLSDRELMFLRFLASNRTRAVSREELFAQVWRMNPRGAGDSRTVDMTVVRLREKLKDDPANPRCIVTVRGKGYMLGEPGTARP